MNGGRKKNPVKKSKRFLFGDDNTFIEMSRCHLNQSRVCGGSCIVFDHRFGCRLKSNGFKVLGTQIQEDDADDFELKEI